MEHASLAAFLAGTLSADSLREEIATEVEACVTAFRAGENAYILISDGPQFDVTREGARRLLSAVAEARLTVEAANYLADCIIMSDDFKFADGSARDAVHSIADDSRPPTLNEIDRALEMLGNQ